MTALRTPKKKAFAQVIIWVTLIIFLFQSTPIPAVGAVNTDESSASTEQTQECRDKRIVAVLFSVGRNKDILAHFDGVSNLDLFQVNGEPLIKHVYDTLRQSKYIQNIVVVATPEVEKKLDLEEDPNTSFVTDRGDAAKNVEFGIDAIQKGDLIMFIPSDLPLVTPEGLDTLIERVLQDKEVDVVFPLIKREIYESKYPDKERAYAHFREGQYTAAHVEFLRPDLFLEHTGEVSANKSSLYNVYYMRKNALGMVRFLGVGLTLKYLFGALSPHDVEQYIYNRYKFRAKALFWDDPDLATDLSEPSDIPIIDGVLQQRALAHSETPHVSFVSTVGGDT